MNHVEKLACYCFEKGFASGRGRGRGDSWTSTGTGIGYMNYLFGRTVKCVCRNRGHVDCYLFLNFEPHGYSTVVTEAVHWLQRGVGKSQSDHRSDKLRVEAAMRRQQV